MRFNLKMKSAGEIKNRLGINTSGRVQAFIDSEVLRLCDPYIPWRTGTMARSGTLHTKIGSGRVLWCTPYVRVQYYRGSGRGRRGRLWFERMKADHGKQIIAGAKRQAKGGGL